MYTDRELQAFDLTRAVTAMAQGSLGRSLEGELLSDFAERTGRAFNANNCVIPWSLLAGRRDGVIAANGDWATFQAMQRRELSRRDLTAAATPDIIPSRELPALDVLRGYAATIEAGARVLQAQGVVSLPETTGEATAYWLSDENAPIAESQPVLDSKTARPHTVGSIISYSHLLRAASAQGEAIVATHLRRLIGKAVDKAALVGSGADGEPLGLLGNPDIETVTIGGDYPAAIRAGLKRVESSGSNPTGWIVGTNAAETLRGTARLAGGSAPILDAGRIEGLPAIISADAPDALVVGDFGDLNIITFGDGLKLAVNDYTRDWQRGIISMRCLADVDVVVRRPASFASLV